MRLSLRRRLSGALAISALAASGVAGAAVGGDDLIACRSKGQVSVLKNGWIRIKAFRPAPGEGPQEIVDFAPAPHKANRIYATNGTVVKVSTNGGCTWNPLAERSNIKVPGGQHETDIFTSIAAPANDVIWVTSYDDAGGVPRPRVHKYEGITPTGDAEHSQPENGLPQVGKPVEFLASLDDPFTNFMLIEEPADTEHARPETTRRLYASYVPQTTPPEVGMQLGLTWKHVPTPASLGSIEGIAIGPSNGVWAWSGNVAALTLDPELDEPTWKEHDDFGGKVHGVDVNRRGQALIAYDGQQGTRGRIADENGNLAKQDGALPVAPVTMAHGLIRGDNRILSGDKKTFAYDSSVRRWVNVTPPGNPGALRGLTMANGAAVPILLGHTKDAFYRFDTFDGEAFVPQSNDARLIDGELVHSEFLQPHFFPRYQEVTVEPGKVKNVTAEFRMPAFANPLDVFFMVDTTGSMQPAIDALRRDILKIARGLKIKLGQQACFGLGEFKDFAAGQALDVYHVRHKISACETDSELPRIREALGKMMAGGGGADLPEAHTIALEQMMTGDGQPNPYVAPNEDAEFRHDAYKVVVLISDAGFRQSSGYPPLPRVAELLKSSEVRIVNVLVQTNDTSHIQGRVDMTELGLATDSVAPPGGVDCNDNQRVDPADVKPGQPIICDWIQDGFDMGRLIVNLLLGVEDPGTVAVTVDDPHDVVGDEPVKGTLSSIMNLKRDVKLPFTLPATCTPAQDGLDLPVTLNASVRALPVDAEGEIVVKCRSVPVVPKPPVRRPPPPVPPEPPIPVVPRVPIPVMVPPPLNPPAQPPANMNLNAGFSQQEEQQLQLAAVTQGAGEEAQDQEELELAMSGLEQDTSATPVAAFLAGAAVLSAATGVAYRRRLQRLTRPGYVRIQ